MPLSREQRTNASVIIRVGQQVGASARDILVALMTALQESGLRNLDYGDRDSVGLFQQRHTMDWGSKQQIMNPEYSARAFFLGAGTNKGLLDYSNRNQMSLTEAAQTVQRSAFPDAYAKHESAARSLLDSLGDGKGVEGTLGAVPGYVVDQPTIGEALQDTLGNHPSAQAVAPSTGALDEATNSALGEVTNPALGEYNNPALATQVGAGVGTPQANLLSDALLPQITDIDSSFKGKKISGDLQGTRGDIVDMARGFLGVPYVWGGTTPAGFDCSGIIQYIYGKLGVNLPRISADQARSGKRVALEDLRPGDLVAWDNSSRNNGADHIAIYIGNGQIIEAPRPGTSVQLNSIYDKGRAWGVAMNL